MRALEPGNKSSVCEACEKKHLSCVVLGLEESMFRLIPMRLCKECGPINLDLMQFCRELTIACNIN